MTIDFNQNYFQLFEIEQSVLIDYSELEKKYLELQKEFHPDKLSGMSDGIINLAKEKFQLIQDSYEYLNKHYV